MGLFGDSEPQIGYIVQDISVTSAARGTYKVWIPKKHWHPDRTDFTGFGYNLGNLTATELELAVKSAEECYPLGPLQSGGAKPFDPATGLVSTDENNPEIKDSTVVQVNGGTITKGKNYYSEGSGANFQFDQTFGADSMTQIYTLGTRSGLTSNTRDGAPKGNIPKLSIGTKVVVIGNFIIGQLPETQSDWINQLAPLNQSM